MPDEHVGTVTQALAPRKGRVTDLRPGDPGRTVVTFEAPARGLIGFRGLLLTATRGTALLHTHHAGWMPWAGELPAPPGRRHAGRPHGRRPPATPSTTSRRAASCSSARASRSTRAWSSARTPVRATWSSTCVREKQKTNIRTHSHDEAVKLAPPKVHTLETAIEFIAEDELVEVTPDAIRIRKRVLAEQDRRRLSRKTG